MEQPKNATTLTRHDLLPNFSPALQKMLIQLQVFLNPRNKVLQNAQNKKSDDGQNKAAAVAAPGASRPRPKPLEKAKSTGGSILASNNNGSASNTPSRKTKIKKSSFKFDHRPYIRRSFTPMSELLQPVTMPSKSYYSKFDDGGLTTSRSFSDFTTTSKSASTGAAKLSSCQPGLSSSFVIETADYDFLESHKIMELYEARIQMGLDEEHQHPALAIKAVEEHKCRANVVSKEENERFNHYTEIKVIEKKPLFWEKRVWDTEKNEMTDTETEKLARQMEESYLIPEVEVTYVPRSQKMQKKKRPRRSISGANAAAKMSKEAAVFNLYAVNFLTDNSDVETDMEDF